MQTNISHSAHAYFHQLRSLPASTKIELISMLSSSLLKEERNKKKSPTDFCGLWKESPVSAEELISKLGKIPFLAEEIKPL